MTKAFLDETNSQRSHVLIWQPLNLNVGKDPLSRSERNPGAAKRTYSILERGAAAPRRTAQRGSEYQPCGTASVFCVVEAKAGRHFTWPTPNRSGREFAKVIRALIGRDPLARLIHRVLDNLNLHSAKSLTDHFGLKVGNDLWKRRRVHYTPKHGSWLNQAEIEISLFSRQCLGRRRIADLATLRRQARAWNRRISRTRVTIQWNFDQKAARRAFGYEKNRVTRSQY